MLGSARAIRAQSPKRFLAFHGCLNPGWASFFGNRIGMFQFLPNPQGHQTIVRGTVVVGPGWVDVPLFAGRLEDEMAGRTWMKCVWSSFGGRFWYPL